MIVNCSVKALPIHCGCTNICTEDQGGTTASMNPPFSHSKGKHMCDALPIVISPVTWEAGFEAGKLVSLQTVSLIWPGMPSTCMRWEGRLGEMWLDWRCVLKVEAFDSVKFERKYQVKFWSERCTVSCVIFHKGLSVQIVVLYSTGLECTDSCVDFYRAWVYR